MTAEMQIIDEVTKQEEKSFYYLDYCTIMGTLEGQHMVVFVHVSSAYHSKMIYDDHKICMLVPDHFVAQFIYCLLQNICYFTYLFCSHAKPCAIAL